MKAGWQKLPFDQAISDESGGNLKTPQSEFLSEGEFAVVDQGKELISGWVNDKARLCRAPSPVVVFGDHTRCIKFVDFPFCMGADGIKVLRPKVDADVKYLFHFLRQLRLHDGGYDRHFKYLKRAEVVLPPLAEQRRIAEVLDRAEALRAKRRTARTQLDSLTQSLFLDLFGGTSATATLSEVAELKRGPFGGALKKEIFVEAGYKVYEQKNAIQNEFLIGRYFINERKFREMKDFAVQPADLIVSCSGTFGKVAIVPESAAPGVINQALLRVRPKADRVTPLFLKCALEQPTVQAKLARASHGTGLQNFPPMSEVRALPIPDAAIELQREFARRVAVVAKLKAAQRASLADLDALFATLQHRAFCGEL